MVLLLAYSTRVPVQLLRSREQKAHLAVCRLHSHVGRSCLSMSASSIWHERVRLDAAL